MGRIVTANVLAHFWGIELNGLGVAGQSDPCGIRVSQYEKFLGRIFTVLDSAGGGSVTVSKWGRGGGGLIVKASCSKCWTAKASFGML